MGNKMETTEPTTRIVKQDTSNSQGQPMKQRIIYEISTEVSAVLWDIKGNFVMDVE